MSASCCLGWGFPWLLFPLGGIPREAPLFSSRKPHKWKCSLPFALYFRFTDGNQLQISSLIQILRGCSEFPAKSKSWGKRKQICHVLIFRSIQNSLIQKNVAWYYFFELSGRYITVIWIWVALKSCSIGRKSTGCSVSIMLKMLTHSKICTIHDLSDTGWLHMHVLVKTKNLRPNAHRMRDPTRNATQANRTYWCEWGCPHCIHCMQATSKEKHSNLLGHRIPCPVWIGPEGVCQDTNSSTGSGSSHNTYFQFKQSARQRIDTRDSWCWSLEILKPLPCEVHSVGCYGLSRAWWIWQLITQHPQWASRSPRYDVAAMVVWEQVVPIQIKCFGHRNHFYICHKHLRVQQNYKGRRDLVFRRTNKAAGCDSSRRAQTPNPKINALTEH